MALRRFGLVARGGVIAVSIMVSGCTEPDRPSPPSGARQVARPAAGGKAGAAQPDFALRFPTTTPIKHVVIIFGENISFDHYFGTYPRPYNNDGEPPFYALPHTPTANTLQTPLDVENDFLPLAGVDLMARNPNLLASGSDANGEGASNPIRLAPHNALTSDMGHAYKAEQQAANGGAMDLFPKYVGAAGELPGIDKSKTTGLVMAYFDGNTVRAMWSYAQEFAMNDNSWTSTFGPSTPGAINLISGQTNGFARSSKPLADMGGNVTDDGNGGYTLIGDPQPLDDACSGTNTVSMAGRNVGDLLNARGISWGWFQGGFDLTLTNTGTGTPTTGCERASAQTVHNAQGSVRDYVPHHQPFQYYASTANPSHARPSSTTSIGFTFQDDGVTPDPANHQYDSHDFFDALKIGNMPAVSYLKAPAFQDGHAGNSNPLDEQSFIVKVVAAVRASPEWASTAIILAYDDSDGWYDHQAPPIVNPSTGENDTLNGPRLCTAGGQQTGPAPLVPLNGVDGKPALGRCGYGTRLPLLVLSPYAKKNYIDHTLTDQTSILRFIEDNWLDAERIQPGGSFDTIAGTIENMFQF